MNKKHFIFNSLIQQHAALVQHVRYFALDEQSCIIVNKKDIIPLYHLFKENNIFIKHKIVKEYLHSNMLCLLDKINSLFTSYSNNLVLDIVRQAKVKKQTLISIQEFISRNGYIINSLDTFIDKCKIDDIAFRNVKELLKNKDIASLFSLCINFAMPISTVNVDLLNAIVEEWFGASSKVGVICIEDYVESNENVGLSHSSLNASSYILSLTQDVDNSIEVAAKIIELANQSCEIFILDGLSYNVLLDISGDTLSPLEVKPSDASNSTKVADCIELKLVDSSKPIVSNIVLSPSSIKQLNANPYFFFIRKILEFSPLNEIGMSRSASDLGKIVHYVLEQFAVLCKTLTIKEITVERFHLLTEELLKNSSDYILLARVKKLASKIVSLEERAKLNNYEVNVEQFYKSNVYNVVSIADRVEVDHTNKEINIYDYKTGLLPTFTREVVGLDVQLSIIANILQEEYFIGYKVINLTYVNVSNNMMTTDFIISGEKLDGLIEHTKRNLKAVNQYYVNNLLSSGKSLDDINLFQCIDSSFYMMYPEIMAMLHYARCKRYANVL